MARLSILLALCAVFYVADAQGVWYNGNYYDYNQLLWWQQLMRQYYAAQNGLQAANVATPTVEHPKGSVEPPPNSPLPPAPGPPAASLPPTPTDSAKPPPSTPVPAEVPAPAPVPTTQAPAP